MDISKNIIRLRTEKRIKQAEISEMLNIEPSNYSRLEKRGDKLTIEQLKKIADALGVHYLELLGEGVGNNNEDLEKEINELREKINDLKPLADMAKAGINNNGLAVFLAFLAGAVVGSRDSKEVPEKIMTDDEILKQKVDIQEARRKNEEFSKKLLENIQR